MADNKDKLITAGGLKKFFTDIIKADYATKQYVDDKDVSDQLTDYLKSETAANTYISKNDAESTYYKKADGETLSGTVGTLNTTVEELKTKVEENKGNVYDVTYNTESGLFSFYENPKYEGDDISSDSTAKKAFTIQGGGGGGGTSTSVLTVTRIGDSAFSVREGSTVQLGFTYSSKDETGDENPTPGTAVWKKGTTVLGTEDATTGDNYFDVSSYITLGTNNITLTVTDPAGSVVTRTWRITVITVSLTSTFNDSITYTANQNVSFSYTPLGTVEKTIHFLHDGKEIDTVTTSSTGVPLTYTVKGQPHGTYNLEVYATATVGSSQIETDHLYFDIIFYDSSVNTPIIAVPQTSYTVKQYNTAAITYHVYNGTSETATVTQEVYSVVDETRTLVSSNTVELTSNTATWDFKPTDVGSYILVLSCGDASKEISITATELGINVSVAEGYAFDFNPVGYSNNNTASRLWTNGTVSMTVSDNFDWTNGGYQVDEDGDAYFCVKAGTTATFDYKLFASDAKLLGKNFKFIYKITNVKDIDTTFLTCSQGTNGTGITMKPHYTYVNSSTQTLTTPLSEEDIIEYEFNITTDTSLIPMFMSYEDGVGSKATVYTSNDDFTQTEPVNITIGSSECDVYVYRMRAYDKSLSNKNILDNFIADSRNAETMIDRYNRNQIYNDYGQLTPESVGEACPSLRIITIEAPYLTDDKKTKVKDCKVSMRYKGTSSDSEETIQYNNWDATGVTINGQGTSSNAYKAAGQNLDFNMKVKDETTYPSTAIVYTLNEDGETYTEIPVGTKLDKDGTYYDAEHNVIEDLSTVYEVKTTVGSRIYLTSDPTKNAKKIKLTDSSVLTNYLNAKVNIASSENANNAILQKRYDRYLPYTSLAKENDDNVKNSMEFYNCVIFLKETDTTTAKQFNDQEYHFYAIGNIGDSKKTDSSRASDADDPNEFCVEIQDVDRSLSTFPLLTDVINAETGKTALEALEADKFDESDTYGFRYGAAPCDETEAGKDAEGNPIQDSLGNYFETESDRDQFTINRQVFVDFYKFIVRDLTTDGVEDAAKVTAWKNEFANWFIQDAALYDYLFTLRYTMVDNRAKNLFLHYGKCPDGKYRFDFWDYDNDTALGIDNAGKLTMSYGVEDEDKDSSGNEYFRCSQSNLWKRIAKHFDAEIRALYKACATNTWKSASTIAEFDEWQDQFPEELWRLDIERKYFRSYSVEASKSTGYGGTGAIELGTNGNGYAANSMYLADMMNGKKKYQRRQFERDQYKYMDSKFIGTDAMNDYITLRCKNPGDGSFVPTVTITPYANMYLNIFTENKDTDWICHERVEAGKPYTITFGTSTTVPDFLFIYTGSRIQSLGDLSKCYPYVCNLGNADKLQYVKIGSDESGFVNESLTSVGVNSAPLLASIDVQNCPNLESVDCSNLHHLATFEAKGSGIKGITFADGGELKIAHLPALTSLVMKNLQYLEDFTLEGYDNLTTLTLENIDNINTYEIVNSSPNLTRVRLVGMNWPATYNIADKTILERIKTLKGINASGYNVDKSVLNGTVHIITIGDKYKASFEEYWSGLTITYTNLTYQYLVTFYDEDGTTIVDTQYVDNKGTIDTSIVKVPTKAQDTAYSYSFKEWSGDDSLTTPVIGNRTYKAVYTATPRTYTVNYAINDVVKFSKQASYGDYVYYTDFASEDGYEEIPTHPNNGIASHYYLFKGWDKTGKVDGDRTINALFDDYTYNYTDFSEVDSNNDFTKGLNDFTPVQLYALTEEGRADKYTTVNAQKALGNMTSEAATSNTHIGDKLNLRLGLDYCFEDVESYSVFDKSYTATSTPDSYSDIKLFDKDKDFTIAIDYEFNSDATAQSVIAESLDNNGNIGFKIYRNGNVASFTYNGTTVSLGNYLSREKVVLRHLKGSDKVYLYCSNIGCYESNNYTVKDPTVTEIAYSTATTDVDFVTGGDLASDGSFGSITSGTVHSLKVWYTDLGNAEALKLVNWVDESLSLTMCGLRRYTLSGQTSLSCYTFVANIPSSKRLSWNTSDTNTGGWASAALNNVLNTRMFKEFPLAWQQLIKKAQIKSTEGNQSSTITSSDCYLAIPSLAEIGMSTSAPFTNETSSLTGTAAFPIFSTAASRIMKVNDSDDEGVSYWTRSPEPTNKSQYIYYATGGGYSSYTYARSMYYIRLMFSI